MIGLRRHPSWRELNGLADEELDADAAAALTEHVVACSKCSRNLSFLRDLREAGRDMRHPSPPKDLWTDIERDREDGQRVILPAAPSAPSRKRRVLPAAAAVAIMAGLAGLATLTLTTEAGAGASDLQFHPASPVPGEEVRVTYKPGIDLSGEPMLKLRVRLRAPYDEPPRDVLGALHEVVLEPDDEGQFVGSLRLPSDFAFAVVAVENLAGDVLDDRDGRLWALRAHAEDGTPLQSALRQEFLVLQNRSWPEAQEVLEEMAYLYPDRAESWSLQLANEPDESGSDAESRARFRLLHAQAERGEPTVGEIASLVRYSELVEDAEARDQWLARLEEEVPAHRVAVSRRVADFGGDRAAAAAYLEKLWSTDGFATRHTCEEGYRAALAEDRAAEARRWALRCLPLDERRELTSDMALTLVAHEGTRAQGMSEMRALLSHLAEGADAERRLHDTPAEVREQSSRLQASLRIRLGAELLAAGDPGAAIAEFNAADELGVWLPELYRARLDATLSLGDRSGALPDFHRLDADPVYSRASVDSLRDRFPSLTEADMAEGRTRAEREMIRRLGAGRISRGLPSVPLFTSTGQSRSLASLVAGRPTILLVWDQRVFRGDGQVSEIIRASRLLAGGPGQLLWITPEPDSESLRSFARDAGLEFPFHDPESELATTLGEWGMRGYFVIDRAGMIRVRVYSLMEAVRHLEVLELELRDTV